MSRNPELTADPERPFRVRHPGLFDPQRFLRLLGRVTNKRERLRRMRAKLAAGWCKGGRWRGNRI